MEALQMLKFLLKKQRLNFTMGWQVDTKDLEVDEVDAAAINQVPGHALTQDKLLESLVSILDEEDLEDVNISLAWERIWLFTII